MARAGADDLILVERFSPSPLESQRGGEILTDGSGEHGCRRRSNLLEDFDVRPRQPLALDIAALLDDDDDETPQNLRGVRRIPTAPAQRAEQRPAGFVLRLEQAALLPDDAR